MNAIQNEGTMTGDTIIEDTMTEDRVLVRSRIHGNKIVAAPEAIDRFRFYGHEWAVTNMINVINKTVRGRFVVTHVETGTCLPGVFRDVPSARKGAKRFLQERGRDELSRAIEACKRRIHNQPS